MNDCIFSINNVMKFSKEFPKDAASAFSVPVYVEDYGKIVLGCDCCFSSDKVALVKAYERILYSIICSVPRRSKYLTGICNEHLRQFVVCSLT